jgi:hypothetical protein
MINQAAHLRNVDTQCRHNLRETAKVLLGYDMSLSDNAFVESSTLIVERKRVNSADGQRIQGRDLEVPQKLSLVTQGSTCALKHGSTGKRIKLEGCQCISDIID